MLLTEMNGPLSKYLLPQKIAPNSHSDSSLIPESSSLKHHFRPAGQLNTRKNKGKKQNSPMVDSSNLKVGFTPDILNPFSKWVRFCLSQSISPTVLSPTPIYPMGLGLGSHYSINPQRPQPLSQLNPINDLSRSGERDGAVCINPNFKDCIPLQSPPSADSSIKTFRFLPFFFILRF